MRLGIIFLVVFISVLSFNAYGQEDDVPIEEHILHHEEQEPCILEPSPIVWKVGTQPDVVHEIVMEQVISEVPIKVQLFWPEEVLPGELYAVKVDFLDAETNELFDDEIITFDITVDTEDQRIETYRRLTTTSGTCQFEVKFPVGGGGPAQVEVSFQNLGEGTDKMIRLYEDVTFNVQVVPEFATLALMVMAIAFVGVIATLRLKNTVIFHN